MFFSNGVDHVVSEPEVVQQELVQPVVEPVNEPVVSSTTENDEKKEVAIVSVTSDSAEPVESNNGAEESKDDQVQSANAEEEVTTSAERNVELAVETERMLYLIISIYFAFLYSLTIKKEDSFSCQKLSF